MNAVDHVLFAECQNNPYDVEKLLKVIIVALFPFRNSILLMSMLDWLFFPIVVGIIPG